MSTESYGQRKLVRNSMASVVQIIVSGVSLFLLYAFLVREINIEIIGVWSLSMTLASLVRIGELGFTGSVVKYVAKALAKSDIDSACRSIYTALIATVVGVGIMSVLIYLGMNWVLLITFSQEKLTLAERILPFGVLFYFLTSTTNIFLFSLEGCHQIVVRSVILIISTLLLLIFTLILVPTYGIYGLLASQLIQVIFSGLVSYITLKTYLPGFRMFDLNVSWRSFREMIRYSLSFNIISIAEILFEPLVKYLIAGIGGLSSIVYYEMASRLVNQLRAAFVAAHKALVPYIAKLRELDPERIDEVYIRSYAVLLFYAVTLFAILASSGYLISYIWIGHFEQEFIIFMMVLSLAWFLNTLTVPAYFSNLGSGHIGWNAVGYVFVVIATWFFGNSMGGMLGGSGVVIGWGLALVLGSFIVVFNFHHRLGISFSCLLPAQLRSYVSVVFIATIIVILVQHYLFTRVALFSLVMPVVYAMLLFNLFWRHPYRDETFFVAFNAVRNR